MTQRLPLPLGGALCALLAVSVCNSSVFAQGRAIERAPLSTPADVEISSGKELAVRGLAAGQVIDKKLALRLKRPIEGVGGDYWVTLQVDRTFMFMARPSERIWSLDPVPLLQGQDKREVTLKVTLSRNREEVGAWSQKVILAKPAAQP